MEYHVAIIGLVSLIILFGWKYIKIKALKSVPPALLVLIVGVLMGLYFHLNDPNYAALKPLVNPGDFKLAFNASFAGLSSDLLPIFLKYVLMFTLVGSLESLLTGKAIDLLDPYQRKANLSKDLTAVGIGNIFAGFLGGLPMISEVARSSANIGNGGRTRWANFFQGISLLVFVVLLTPLIKMVPVASLSAMLIFVGFRLAAPKEFVHAYHIGFEQLSIFVVTVIATICTDLLIGIGAGILLKLIIQLASGVPFKYIFRQPIAMSILEEEYLLEVSGAATFSNLLNIKKHLDKVPSGANVRIDLEKSRYVDHTVLENLHNYKREHELNGGNFKVTGIERHKPLSEHPLAARKNKNDDLIQRN
jgi:MFS superfamily sulfate permease-like transporter